ENLDTEEPTEPTEPTEETEETEEEGDLDALLEDLDTTEPTEEETEEEGDLDALLEDLDTDISEKSETEARAEDLETLLDDLDTDDTTDDAQGDLDALLDDLDVGEEATEETDLDALLDDLDTDMDEDPEVLPEDDLDTLLGEDLNIGVEDEVAQILATGEPSDTSNNILEDFKSVQESILHDPEAPDDWESATLLLIDDNPDNRNLFKDTLSGYKFIEVENSYQVMDILQDGEVGLVLLNLDIQTEDALDILEETLADPDLPNLPVIVSSEHTDRIEKALRLGATDYLMRPLGVMDLEFQVPQKVANQLKLRKAEHLLAGGGESIATLDLPPSPDDDDLLTGDLDDDDFLIGDPDEKDFLLDDDDELLPEDILAGVVSPSKKDDPLIPMSDQRRLLQDRREGRTVQSRLPLFLGIALLIVAAVGLIFNYADDVIEWVQQPTAKPPAPRPLPVLKPPTVPQKEYATARKQAERPNTYERQGEIVKTRIRRTVQDLATNGGTWWSPWKIMRESGASVGQLIRERTSSDILDAFGMSQAVLETGLQSERTLDYLASVGFDLHGKTADELTARETFELLSAREIKGTEQIINILSNLTDKLVAERTEKARQKTKKTGGQAMLHSPVFAPGDRDQTVCIQTAEQIKHPVLGSAPEIRGNPPVPIPPLIT
ncbi:MAG: response regulator, partial [bacterium]|nr:response regulator [bacterium]